MLKDLYFLRHGQTLYNVQKRVQGKGIDSSLDETGLAQRDAFFDTYKQHPFQLIITSSLKRTIETVSPFSILGIPQIQVPEIDEISWGIYEGKEANEEMRLAHKTVIEHWTAGRYHARIEGGESAFELAERLDSFLQLLKKRPEQKILICTHGGCLAFLMTILREQPLSAMAQYRHRNTGLCHFIFDGNQFLLQLQDDTRHLNNLILD